MKTKDKVFSTGRSWVVSSLAWLYVIVGTILFSLYGLVVLWPLSVVFENASGRLPHRLSQSWARQINRGLSLWQLGVKGLEKIENRKPYVVVVNHQSVLDILAVLAGLPIHFKFIAKQELFWVPFLGWHLQIARYIPLKRGNPESGRQCLEKARNWLRRGVSIVFFPEGTRSPDGAIKAFKAGAFKLALEEKIDLLPVVIGGTREIIPKRSWQIERGRKLAVSILDPVKIDPSADSLETLRDRVRLAMMKELERLKA